MTELEQIKKAMDILFTDGCTTPEEVSHAQYTLSRSFPHFKSNGGTPIEIIFLGETYRQVTNSQLSANRDTEGPDNDIKASQQAADEERETGIRPVNNAAKELLEENKYISRPVQVDQMGNNILMADIRPELTPQQASALKEACTKYGRIVFMQHHIERRGRWTGSWECLGELEIEDLVLAMHIQPKVKLTPEQEVMKYLRELQSKSNGDDLYSAQLSAANKILRILDVGIQGVI